MHASTLRYIPVQLLPRRWSVLTCYQAINPTTRGMIVRAHVEMSDRLDRALKSVKTFFNDQLPVLCVGLSPEAQHHMHRFRSFLMDHFKVDHGLWPPVSLETSFALQCSLYHSMYSQFQALLDYLVDSESTDSSLGISEKEGDFPLGQNLRAFDASCGFQPLPHPLPLIPRCEGFKRRSLIRHLKRRTEDWAREGNVIDSAHKASKRDPELLRMPLVKKYDLFETQIDLDDPGSLGLAEARKVRWLLVYAAFQILSSAVSTAEEIQEAGGLSYPLCCAIPTRLSKTDDSDGKSASSLEEAIIPTTSSRDGKKSRSIRNKLRKPALGFASLQESEGPPVPATSPSSKIGRLVNFIGHSDTSGSKSTHHASLLQIFQRRRKSVPVVAETTIYHNQRAAHSAEALVSRQNEVTNTPLPPPPTIPAARERSSRHRHSIGSSADLWKATNQRTTIEGVDRDMNPSLSSFTEMGLNCRKSLPPLPSTPLLPPLDSLLSPALPFSLPETNDETTSPPLEKTATNDPADTAAPPTPCSSRRPSGASTVWTCTTDATVYTEGDVDVSGDSNGRSGDNSERGGKGDDAFCAGKQPPCSHRGSGSRKEAGN